MGGLSGDAAMGTRYDGAPMAVRRWWSAAVAAAVGYGVVLAVIAARAPAGAELTGRFAGQPALKALMAVLLAVAAAFHPIVRERRWLVAATLCRLSIRLALRSTSPISQRPVAPSSNGWKARNCRVSKPSRFE